MVMPLIGAVVIVCPRAAPGAPSILLGSIVPVSGLRPRAEHGPEVRAHGVEATHGHGAPADGEVVGRELARPREVPRRRLGSPLLVEPLSEPELGAGLLVGLGGQFQARPRLGPDRKSVVE